MAKNRTLYLYNIIKGAVVYRAVTPSYNLLRNMAAALGLTQCGCRSTTALQGPTKPIMVYCNLKVNGIM